MFLTQYLNRFLHLLIENVLKFDRKLHCKWFSIVNIRAPLSNIELLWLKHQKNNLI